MALTEGFSRAILTVALSSCLQRATAGMTFSTTPVVLATTGRPRRVRRTRSTPVASISVRITRAGTITDTAVTVARCVRFTDRCILAHNPHSISSFLTLGISSEATHNPLISDAHQKAVPKLHQEPRNGFHLAKTIPQCIYYCPIPEIKPTTLMNSCQPCQNRQR